MKHFFKQIKSHYTKKHNDEVTAVDMNCCEIITDKKTVASILNNERGDFYVSEGVKVIIAVILGSILITAMVTLFNSQIIPGIQDKITALFSTYSATTIPTPTVTPYGG